MGFGLGVSGLKLDEFKILLSLTIITTFQRFIANIHFLVEILRSYKLFIANFTLGLVSNNETSQVRSTDMGRSRFLAECYLG